MRYWILIILTGLFGLPGIAQTDSVLNQLDNKGKKHGKWVKKDAKGNRVYTGTFENGVPVDTFRYFTPKQKLKAIAIHSDKKDVVRMINYHSNGNVQATGKYINKEKDSIWTFYRKDGTLVSKENFSKGKLNDTSRYYYYSGALLKKTFFNDGVKQGEETIYYENGQLNKKLNYDQGKLHGAYIVFYPDGDTMTSGQYQQDLKTGTWSYYGEEGNLIKEENFNP